MTYGIVGEPPIRRRRVVFMAFPLAPIVDRIRRRLVLIKVVVNLCRIVWKAMDEDQRQQESHQVASSSHHDAGRGEKTNGRRGTQGRPSED